MNAGEPLQTVSASPGDAARDQGSPATAPPAVPAASGFAAGPSPSPGKLRGGVYPGRFEFLDALRGLAALAVVVHHVASVYIGGPAVMAFFVISGYCIAAASASARRNKLGFKGFMWRRVRRIMPPYLLAIGFWAVYRMIKATGGGPNELARPWTDWVQNLTLTQWLTMLREPQPYPPGNPTLFVGAFWSLCYEEQFYIVMGLMAGVAALSGVASRWVVAGLLVAGLAWNVVFPQTCYGIFIEYWAPFALGCLVFYRLCELPRTDAPEATARTRAGSRAIDASLVLMAVGAGVVFWRQGGFPEPTPDGTEFRSVAGELLVASVVAIVLLLVRPFDGAMSRGAWFTPLRWLGKITFSLYLVHQFNLIAAKRAAGVVLGAENVDTILGYMLRIAILVVIGAVFWFFCERPFLNKPLKEG